ncbi:MAG: acetyltransferase [bacterium]
MKPVVLLGAGGHARVLLDILKLQKRLVASIVDPALSMSVFRGIPVLQQDEDVLRCFRPEEVELVNGIGSTGDNCLRRKLYYDFKKQGYNFAVLLHPRAIVAENVILGSGTQVMAGSVIQTDCVIGENTIINTGTILDHDCRIGSNVHLAPGCILSGGVKISDDVHLGTGTTVIQNIAIGRQCLIGAGSVVISDIQEKNKAWGVPAKEVK